MQTFALKGNIIYSRDKDNLETVQQGYLLCENGFSGGVHKKLPEKYENIPVVDHGDSLILPGLCDLHAHAPQYAMRANGMDLKLLEWLNTYTFPMEQRYADISYAGQAYARFAEDVKKSATTRMVLFATVHREATWELMEQLEATGIRGFVGKVNMDRNCPEYIREENAAASLAETKKWLEDCGHLARIRPILTPRFIPCCSDELLEKLGQLQKEKKLPLQSHLSENPGEIAWVKELCPEAADYGEAYDNRGVFGTNGSVIMAHCVYSVPEEVERIKKNGVFVAHCPQSNTNLSSGAAPVKAYLKQGIKVGLGTDVAGGCHLSVFRAMADAIQVSKLRSCLVDPTTEPLSLEEAFYLGTKGGGAFFGKVGSFEEGYEFDAIIMNDSRLLPPHVLSLKERLERVVYLSEDRDMIGKYVMGESVFAAGTDK